MSGVVRAGRRGPHAVAGELVRLLPTAAPLRQQLLEQHLLSLDPVRVPAGHLVVAPAGLGLAQLQAARGDQAQRPGGGVARLPGGDLDQQLFGLPQVVVEGGELLATDVLRPLGGADLPAHRDEPGGQQHPGQRGAGLGADHRGEQTLDAGDLGDGPHRVVVQRHVRRVREERGDRLPVVGLGGQTQRAVLGDDRVGIEVRGLGGRGGHAPDVRRARDPRCHPNG